MVREITASDTTELVLRRLYPAPPEQVFRAWTDPEQLKQWFQPMPGVKLVAAKIDGRPGGAYEFVYQVADQEHQPTVSGTFHEFSPPNRLVFTWTWNEPEEFAGHETLVAIDLQAVDDQTQLVLTHTKFPAEAMRESHSKGWTGAVDSLVQYMQSVCRSLPAGERPF